MTLFTVTAISFALLGLGALLMVIGQVASLMWLFILGIVVIVGSFVFELVMHRCPHCRSYIKNIWYSYCPYCGEEINDGEKFFLREKNNDGK